MQIDGIHEEYSYDRLYRFVVCRKPDYFEVWVQKKVIDEYLDPDDTTPEEIIADQLSNHMPVALKGNHRI